MNSLSRIKIGCSGNFFPRSRKASGKEIVILLEAKFAKGTLPCVFLLFGQGTIGPVGGIIKLTRKIMKGGIIFVKGRINVFA